MLFKSDIIYLSQYNEKKYNRENKMVKTGNFESREEKIDSLEFLYQSKLFSQITFLSLYDELSKFYQNLQLPTPSELERFQTDLSIARRKKRIRFCIIISLLTIFFFLTVPLMLHSILNLAKAAQNSIFLNSFRFLKEYPSYEIGLFLSLTVAIFLSIYLNNVIDEVKNEKNKNFFYKVNQKSSTATIFKFILFYFIIIAISFIYRGEFNPTVFTHAVRLYIFVPLFMISLVPYYFVFYKTTILFSYEDKHPTSIYALILFKLLILLYMLRNMHHPRDLNMSEKNNAIIQIKTISKLFYCFFANERSNESVSVWSNEKMAEIADNFLSLSTWIITPMNDTINSLKMRLVYYVNVLIKGTLHEFSNDSNSDKPVLKYFVRGPSEWQSIGNLIWLLILIISPLIIYVAFALFVKIEIPNSLHTPIAIAYSTWIAVVSFRQLESSSVESKMALIDIIKSTFKSH